MSILKYIFAPFAALLLWALPASAQIGNPTTCNNSQGSAGPFASLSCSASINVSSGGTLVVACRAQGGTNDSTSVSDTAGNTFTTPTNANAGAGANDFLKIWVAKNTIANATDTPACNYGGTGAGFPSINALFYTGADTTSPVDVATGTNTGNASSITSPTFSTANASERIIACASQANLGATFTAGATYTIRVQDPSPFSACEDKQVLTIQSSVTASMSSSLGGSWEIVVVSIKAAGAAPPPTPPSIKSSLMLLEGLGAGTAVTPGGVAPPPGNCRAWQPTGPVQTVSGTSDLQSAVNNAAAGTILDITGSITVPSEVVWKSHIHMKCEPGVSIIESGTFPTNNNLIHLNGTTDTSFWNCTFDGGTNSGAGGCGAGFCSALFYEGGASNLNVINNQFKRWGTANTTWFGGFNSQALFFQRNGPSPGDTTAWQPVSIHSTDAVTHRTGGIYVTDNTLSGCNRNVNGGFCLEALLDNDDNPHFDRNTGQNVTAPGGATFLSIVQASAFATTNGTVIGNVFKGASNDNNLALEIADNNYTVTGNNFTAGLGFLIGHGSGTWIDSNNISVTNAAQKDGGWDQTVCVGTNTVNGTPTTNFAAAPSAVAGCPPTLYPQSLPACAPQ